MKTFKSFFAKKNNRHMIVNETSEPDLADFPWTIYVETDAVDPLFQKFQTDHFKFLKNWMKTNITQN